MISTHCMKQTLMIICHISERFKKMTCPRHTFATDIHVCRARQPILKNQEVAKMKERKKKGCTSLLSPTRHHHTSVDTRVMTPALCVVCAVKMCPSLCHTSIMICDAPNSHIHTPVSHLALVDMRGKLSTKVMLKLN